MKNKRLLLIPVLLLFTMSIVFPVFSAPLEDVDDAYSVSLLHFDGDDASTTITDEAGKSWTAVGNAQLDTALKKFGSASLLLDGSGDYLLTDNTNLDLSGGEDFTIDMWLYLNEMPNNTMIFNSVDPDNNYYMRFSETNYEFYSYDGSGYPHAIVRDTTISINTWIHFAFVRSGDTYYIFQDGTLVGSSYTDTDELPVGETGVFALGANVFYIGETLYSGYYIDGQIDEFRYSKGIARWTSNFTPPSEHYYPSPTPTVTSISVTDTPTFTPRPPYAEATAYIDSRITYGEAAVTISIAGLCLVVIIAGLIALGLYIGQRERRK